MTEPKTDFYTGVHKGLRRALFALTSNAARTDVLDPNAVVAIGEELDAVLALMDAHAHHEDAFVLPLVKRVAPDLAAQLEHVHADLESRATIVRHAFDRMATSSAETRSEWMQAAHAELCAFVGEHLVHMAFEERTVMPALAARVSAEDLHDTHVRLVGAIAPDEMARFLSTMLPAISPAERLGMFAGMRHGPSEPFAEACALAERVLSAQEWRALRAGVGLEPVAAQ